MVACKVACLAEKNWQQKFTCVFRGLYITNIEKAERIHYRVILKTDLVFFLKFLLSSQTESNLVAKGESFPTTNSTQIVIVSAT